MKKVVPSGAKLVPDQAKLVFSGVIFDTYQWPQTLFDGSQATFEMLKRSDTVVIIPIEKDSALVVENEQPGLNKHVTFPGGQVDSSDESTLAAAQRELLEETGYTYKDYKLIDIRQPYLKIEWFVYTYVAWNIASIGEPHPDPGEKTKARRVSLDQINDYIAKNEGYFREHLDLFRGLKSLDDLTSYPEQSGTLVER